MATRSEFLEWQTGVFVILFCAASGLVGAYVFGQFGANVVGFLVGVAVAFLASSYLLSRSQ